jgi:hypothetical protein
MTLHSWLPHTLLALTLTTTWPALAATEIVPLNYRMADEILPLAQSLLGNEGSVNAYGNQLIVNAAPSKIAELRDLLSQLDTAPRRLLISVDSSEGGFSDDRGYSVDGAIRAGDVELEAGRGQRHGSNQVRILRRDTSSRGGGIQQVQTNEGYPALIQIGQSVPLTNSSSDGYGQIYNQTQYRDVTRGFYVTASLSGERVHLNINSNRDRLNQSRPQVIDVQQTQTQVSGRLGEWIPFGGISEQFQSSQNSLGQRYSTQGRENLSLRIKVEVVD